MIEETADDQDFGWSRAGLSCRRSHGRSFDAHERPSSRGGTTRTHCVPGMVRTNGDRIGPIPMAENKTQITDASVEDYIAARGSEQQRADCRELIALLKKATQQPPRMWGTSIVGFGSYRYTYESGRTGEAPLASFAIRGRDLVRTSRSPCCPISARTRWAGPACTSSGWPTSIDRGSRSWSSPRSQT